MQKLGGGGGGGGLVTRQLQGPVERHCATRFYTEFSFTISASP